MVKILSLNDKLEMILANSNIGAKYELLCTNLWKNHLFQDIAATVQELGMIPHQNQVETRLSDVNLLYRDIVAQ